MTHLIRLFTVVKVYAVNNIHEVAAADAVCLPLLQHRPGRILQAGHRYVKSAGLENED